MEKDPLRLLSYFEELPKGPRVYFRALAADADEIVAFGAWCQLTEAGLVRPDEFDTILGLCRHAAMRSRAFAFFSRRYDYPRAEQVAATPVADGQPELMRAVLSHDPARQAVALRTQYFAEARAAVLAEAGRFADEAEGWAARTEWLLRAVVLHPRDELAVSVLAWHLVEAGQRELVLRLHDALKPFANYAHICASIRADVAWLDRRADDCLAELRRIETEPGPDGKPARLFASGYRLRAQALEQKGDYRAAFANFETMNRLDAPNFGDRLAFLKLADQHNALDFPAGMPAARRDHVMMLGFPRSGTTLLENALAMHEKVETFEEIASIDRVEKLLDIARVEKGGIDLAAATGAQAAYYDELARRSKSPAPVKVDKTPIRSARARLMRHMFPGQRYLFSIRHPYDVVLSNFKQRYAPNLAMANFLSLADSVRAYDHVMSAWFASFGLDDPDVCYLRYDELVTDFRATMGRALGFIGLDWSEQVLDFAKGAEARAARTPSYAKVRSGLGLGVQSTYQNYLFAFAPEERKLLDKWCAHFGYAAPAR